MARPFDRHGYQRPGQQRVEHEHQRDRGQRRLTQRHLGEWNAEEHVIGEDPAQREYGLSDAVQPEEPRRDEAGEHEHDDARSEIRDEQARIDRRQPGKIAHQPEQQRRYRHREYEARQPVGHRFRPASPSRQDVAQQHQHEKRRGQPEDARERLHDRSISAPAGDAIQTLRLPISERNSSRVATDSRKVPSTEDVIMIEFCFSTPRIIMHRWRASIITPTPRAPIDSMTSWEICSVSRSWSCSRRAYMSTTRASLETPNTRP